MTLAQTQGERAFAEVRVRLEELRADTVHAARVNLQRAAGAALNVSDFLGRPEIRDRYEQLAAKGQFQLAHLADLPRVAWAARYVKQQLQLATQASTEVQVPLALFQDATARRSRMLKVLEYHLGDDPVVAARLAAVRGGKGHQDLANDLLVLGDLYRYHAVALAEDRRHYRADDEVEAGESARHILRILSSEGSPDLARWTDLHARVWTLLERIYDEVRRAGQFLFYYEDPEGKFPTLFAAARSKLGEHP